MTRLLRNIVAPTLAAVVVLSGIRYVTTAAEPITPLVESNGPTREEKVDILWEKHCETYPEEPACQTSPPTSAPSGTSSAPPPSSTTSPPVPTASPTASPTPAPTSTPTPTPSPTPPPTPAPNGTDYIGPDVAGLPTSGSAWTRLLAAANGSWGSSTLTTDQDNRHNIKVLAGALVYARTGDAAMRTKVRNALMATVAAGAPRADNAILSMGRQLGGYVMAADYIGLSGADDAAFRAWLAPLRTNEIGTHGRYKSLVGTALDSGHNWGTFALASLIAADIYLDDAAAIERDWAVFRGYVDRTAYSGFEQYPPTSSGRGSWSCRSVPYTPANGGCPGDLTRWGAWPKDVGRGGDYPTLAGDGINYSKEILQGIAVSAELLWQRGYTTAYSVLLPAWSWARDNAIYNRANVSYHVAPMVNARLGWSLPVQSGGNGRLFEYADWLLP